MKILKYVQSLHESTKIHQYRLQKGTMNKDIAARMYLRRFEINRIGKFWDDVLRSDLDTDVLLKSYLARKIYINEKRIYINSDRIQEEAFSTGLWKIWCNEVFGTLIPELNVPCTFKELQDILDCSEQHMQFSLYDTIQKALTHSAFHGYNGFFKNMTEFDLFCSLPGDASWTSSQTRASKCDNRKFSAQRYIQASIGMFKLDYLNCSEPYPHFWKQKAQECLNYAICRLEKDYELKFRNATVYDNPEICIKPDKYPPAQPIISYIKKETY